MQKAFFLILMTANCLILEANEGERETKHHLEISVDMTAHLQHQSSEERTEQVRDWLAIACLNQLNISQNTTFRSLYDFPAMRYEEMGGLNNYQYGESRYIPYAGKLLVLVPTDSEKTLIHIARASDAYRMKYARMPKTARVYTYDISDVDAGEAFFAYDSEVSGGDVFSSSYGYYEQSVDRKGQLETLLTQIDNVCYVGLNGNSVRIGGRKFSSGASSLISVNDLATLYQAEEKLRESHTDRIRKRGVRSEYEAHVRENVSSNYWRLLFQFPEITRSEIDEGFREKYPYSDFLQEYIDAYLKDVSVSIGFSLDPDVRRIALYNDVRNMVVKRDTQYFNTWFDEHLRKGILESLAFERQEVANFLDERRTDFLDLSMDNYETSTHSLVFGSESGRSEDMNEDSYSFWLELFGLSEEETEPYLREYKASIGQVFGEHSLLLQKMIEKDRFDKDLPAYYELLRLLDNRETFTISREQAPPGLSTTPSNFNEALNQKVLGDALAILKDFGMLSDSTVDHFSKEVEDSLKKFQSILELPVTGKIDDVTYAAFTKYSSALQRKNAILEMFLESVYRSNSFQMARYDGPLQNTEIGMTLFYTDLMMKLWGFNYEDSAPEEAIPGFKAKTNHPISIAYFDNIQEYPGTRSWLGDQEGAYQFYGNNTRLMFAPSATRIYNASSNDLFPGIEVDANYSSQRFSDWWNRHYLNIADYEPEFHRLNQIMKWNVVLTWLREKGKLSFLNSRSYKVAYLSEDFESWFKGKDDLRFRHALPFLDATQLGEGTECLDLFKSKPFYLFENNYTPFSMSGGVSLPSPAKIANRLKQRRSVKYAGQTPVIKSTSFEAEISVGRSSVKKTTTGSKTYYSKTGEVSHINSLETRITKDGNTTTILNKTNSEEMGKLIVKDLGTSSRLELAEGGYAKGRNLVADLERSKEPSQLISGSRHVDFVLQISDQEHLIKLSNNEQWMKFTTNVSYEQAKVAQFSTAVEQGIYHVGDLVDVSMVLKNLEGKQMYRIGMSRGSAGVRAEEVVSNIENTYRLRSKSGDVAFALETNYLNEAEVLLAKSDDLSKDIEHIKAIKELSGIEEGRTLLAALDDNAICFVKNSKGEVSSISKNNVPVQRIDALTSQLNLQNSNAKVVVVSSSEHGVRVSGEAGHTIVHLPSAPDDAVVATLGRMDDHLVKPEWQEAFKAFGDVPITVKDINQMEAIQDANGALRKTIPEMNKVKSLKAGDVVVDFNSMGKQPQVLVLDQAGKPRVLNLDFKGSHNFTETGKILKNKLGSGEKITLEEYKKLTEGAAQMLDQVIAETGAKRLVTLEPEGLNLTIAKEMHGIKPKVELILDQRDIQQSVFNASDTFLLDFKQAKYITSVSLADTFKTVNQINQSVLSTGVTFDTTLTSLDFWAYPSDSLFGEQNVLVVRSNNHGILLNGTSLSYDDLRSTLESLNHKKDFVYLLSNNCDSLKNIFIESGKFSRVYFSTYELGNLASFEKSFEQATALFRSFDDDSLVLKKKTLRKLKRQDRETYEILSHNVTRNGRYRVVYVNRTSASEKSKLNGKSISTVNLSNTNATINTELSFEKVDRILGNQNKKITTSVVGQSEDIGPTLRALATPKS